MIGIWRCACELEYFEYFCQMSSKSSYTVQKLVRFLRHSVYNSVPESQSQSHSSIRADLCGIWSNSIKYVSSVLHCFTFRFFWPRFTCLPRANTSKCLCHLTSSNLIHVNRPIGKKPLSVRLFAVCMTMKTVPNAYTTNFS